MRKTRADFRVTVDYLAGLQGQDVPPQDMSGTFYISKPLRDTEGEMWDWEPVYAGSFPVTGEAEDNLLGGECNPWLDIFAAVAPDADPTRYANALPITSNERLVSLLRQVYTHGHYLRIRHEDTKGRSK